MNTTTERLTDRMESVAEIEVVELGGVLEETKGSPMGSTWDGLGGRKIP